MKKYFVYSADNGFETFDTEAEAEAVAENIITLYREDAGDEGWDEDVESVCWGELRQKAIMTKLRPAPNRAPNEFTYDYWLGTAY